MVVFGLHVDGFGWKTPMEKIIIQARGSILYTTSVIVKRVNIFTILHDMHFHYLLGRNI